MVARPESAAFAPFLVWGREAMRGRKVKVGKAHGICPFFGGRREFSVAGQRGGRGGHEMPHWLGW